MKWIFSPVVFAGLLAVGAIIGSTAQAQDRAAESALEGEFQRGFQLQKQGRTHDAVLAYEAALRRLPQAVNSANSANLLNNLGDLYMIESRFDEAEQSYQACLKLKIQRHGPLARTTLRTMFMLAVLAGQKDDNETALKRYAELLELQIKAFGRMSPDVAKTLSYQAGILMAQSLPEETEPILAESIRIYEKLYGPRHPDLLDPVANMALVQADLGRPNEAERLLARAFSLTELLKDESTRLMQLSLLYNSWASVSGRNGRYAQAERAYLANFDTLAKIPTMVAMQATVLLDLGSLYWRMGLLDKSAATLNRSVELARKNGPGIDKQKYSLLLALAWGRLYRNANNYPEAEKMLFIARDLSIQLYGEEHTRTNIVLDDLASVYREMGRYDDAETLARKSLRGFENRLPADHPEVATSRAILANILLQQGKIAEAREQFERVLAVHRVKLAPINSQTIYVLTCLGRIAARQGRWDDAHALISEARRNTRRNISEVLPELAPAEQLEFLFREDAVALTWALSLSAARSSDAAMRAAGAEWLLNSKGVAQQALAERTVEERTSADPRAAEIVSQLQTVRRQLIRLRGKAAEADKVPEQLAARINELMASEAKLAAEFAKLAGLAYRADPWIELTELRGKLPANTRFVEIARTQIFTQDGSGPESPDPHYLAWIVPPAGAGDVQLVDLGLADAIEGAVLDARSAIEQAPEQIEKAGRREAEGVVREPLTRLARIVLEPLVVHLGSAQRIELSPDANLWLVPWAALPLADGRYAVEKYDIHYQISGRELVTADEPLPTGPPVIFADPDYDLSPGEAAKAAKSVLRGAQRPVPADPLSPGVRAGIHVARLPGTAREAAAIAPSLEQFVQAKPQVYLDRWALESVFKAVRRPRVLVASTHGFFLPDQAVSIGPTGERGDRAAVPVTRGGEPMQNPLARCGLLLAGCNQPVAGAQQDDGILTGLEIVGTDLRGTELVALSACQTGLGDLNRGEGVAGLRQAFQLAGARAVIATLWSIADDETAALMADLFGNLAAGKSKSEALRAAQIKMIETQRAQDKSTHPFYWAPFTLTGI